MLSELRFDIETLNKLVCFKEKQQYDRRNNNEKNICYIQIIAFLIKMRETGKHKHHG